MKNYLILLKKALMKNKNVYVPKVEQDDTKTDKPVIENVDENKKIINIANALGLEFAIHSLKKLSSQGGWNGANRYNIDDSNMIFLYPVNDGMPTCPFEFWKDGKLVLHNQNVYSEITNLDEIILQIVRIFNKSLDEGIVLDPYYFMLKLNDEAKENYKGSATLVITEKAIRNQKLNEQNFDEATKYFINHFLDHFIGWNFGVSVNRNETLKEELLSLNNKVIEMGIREYAGSGFEVYGVDDEVHNGLQHFTLPKEKENVLTKKKENANTKHNK